MNTKGLPEIFLGVVQNQKGEVLIVHRVPEEKGNADTVLSWVFPGGEMLDEEETGEEVLIRTLLEETGYRVKPGSVISEREHPDFPVYVYYVACELVDPDPIVKPSDPEVETPKWVKPEEIPSYFTSNFDPKVKNAIKNICLL
jgi:8-oxo-dGTP pyrophosphatase MutT (NUDIX family)